MTRARCAFLSAFLMLTPIATGCGASGEGAQDETTGAGAGGDGFSGGAGGSGGEADPQKSATDSRSGGDGEETPAADMGTTALENKLLPECKGDAEPLSFYLSSDDSNSMASPILAREWLEGHTAPPAGQIRTYEFLNYYNAIYELPKSPEAGLGVHLELQPEPINPDKKLAYRLQIGVQAFDVPRVPLVLTYVIDTSGSLVGPGMERARDALLAIGDHLEPGDILNVVTWSNDDNVLLDGYVATGDDAATLGEVVGSLVPGGGSDLHSGLTKGYELAEAHFDATRLNRVVLVSDGGANLGVLDRETIAAAAEKADADGIYLVGVGVGPAKGYTDALMNVVTDAGKGAYVYLDGKDEAQEVFTARFDEVMRVAARDVRVQLDLPPWLEIEHFYGEEYSQDASLIEPQHLAPRDAMIFNQTVYATSSTSACGLDLITVRVTWETPLTHEAREEPPVTLDINTLLSPLMSPQMEKANAVVAYAEALKTGQPVDLENAATVIQAASENAPSDTDLIDILELIQLHPNFPAKPE